MKIIFVGLHNKEGLPALCSTTKSGEIIDIICSHFNGVTFEKKNIFPVEYLPQEIEEREKFIDEFEVEEDAFYVSLGTITRDAMKRITGNLLAVYHPGYILRRGLKAKENYIREVVRKLEQILTLSQIS